MSLISAIKHDAYVIVTMKDGTKITGRNQQKSGALRDEGTMFVNHHPTPTHPSTIYHIALNDISYVEERGEG